MAKRGVSYRPHEDTALCYAWISISTDAAVGRNQSADTFYQRLLAVFNERVRAE